MNTDIKSFNDLEQIWQGESNKPIKLAKQIVDSIDVEFEMFPSYDLSFLIQLEYEIKEHIEMEIEILTEGRIAIIVFDTTNIEDIEILTKEMHGFNEIDITINRIKEIIKEYKE